MKQYSCEIISCLRRMICCSCHTPTSTYTYIMKKAQMTSRKGPTHPWKGCGGDSEACSLKPYAPDSVGWWMMEDGCRRRKRRRKVVEEFKNAHKKKQKNERRDEYKSEFTSPASQKILKLGGSNKGIWQSMRQKFQMLMIYISPKF